MLTKEPSQQQLRMASYIPALSHLARPVSTTCLPVRALYHYMRTVINRLRKGTFGNASDPSSHLLDHLSRQMDVEVSPTLTGRDLIHHALAQHITALL